MDLDLTRFNAALKEIAIPEIQAQHNLGTAWMARVKKTAKHIDAGGKYAKQVVRLGTPQGHGARADGGLLPIPVPSLLMESQIPIVSNYTTFGITGKTMRAASSDVKAWAKALPSEIKAITDSFLRDMNRQFIAGDGTGVITAQINAGVGTPIGGSQIEVASTVDIHEGMAIEFWHWVPGAPVIIPCRGAAVGGPVTITVLAITSETTFTIADASNVATTTDVDLNAATYASGIKIIRHGAKGNEIIGLPGWVDDGTIITTYESINRGTYSRWQAKKFPMGGIAVDHATLQKAFSHREKAGLGKGIVVTSYGIRDQIAVLLAQKQQFNSPPTSLKGGFETPVTFNGAPIWAEEQAKKGVIFFPDEGVCQIHRQSDVHWADEDGSVLKWVSLYDKYFAFLYYDAQMGASRCNSSSYIDGVLDL